MHLRDRVGETFCSNEPPIGYSLPRHHDVWHDQDFPTELAPWIMEKELALLGLELPEVSTPGGNYVSVNIRGSIAYVAIQFPILNGVFLFQGILGDTLTTSEGRDAMELCALNVLAQVNAKIGMHRVSGLNHIEALYRAAPGWDEAPLVLDGASDLLVAVLGEKGRHSRSLLGVADLPRGFSVGLTCSFTLSC